MSPVRNLFPFFSVLRVKIITELNNELINQYKISNGMSKGFTLIEIMVVVSVIVVISAIVIFNIGLEKQNSALFRSAQKLSLDLRRTQSFALSSKNYKTSGIPCGWGVHFTGANSTSYIIFADSAVLPDCSDRDFIRAANGTEDFETINLESGIKISSLSGNLSDAVFTPPDPIVRFTPDQALVTIVLMNKNSATRKVNVNKAGLVSFQ
ncbi:MAG: prepilin-type N-terminal cleavage/methylation domain-containing protein [Parcubacteria group bacterium]|nr:prepilin-type N-terminal cleavage/methylation domain-containing protein [Parcubacteria group bacterium]